MDIQVYLDSRFFRRDWGCCYPKFADVFHNSSNLLPQFFCSIQFLLKSNPIVTKLSLHFSYEGTKFKTLLFKYTMQSTLNLLSSPVELYWLLLHAKLKFANISTCHLNVDWSSSYAQQDFKRSCCFRSSMRDNRVATTTAHLITFVTPHPTQTFNTTTMLKLTVYI